MLRRNVMREQNSRSHVPASAGVGLEIGVELPVVAANSNALHEVDDERQANPELNRIMSSSQGHFIWYELATTNMETAKLFYTKVVGWGAQDVAMPGVAYTLFTAEGAPICGLMSLPEDARESGYRPTWLGYIAVDDVDFTAGRIAQLGGEIHVPSKEIPNISRFAVAVDPQRVTIAVFKWLDGGGQQPPALDAPGHVGWHELLAADRVKAFAFYAELFG